MLAVSFLAGANPTTLLNQFHQHMSVDINSTNAEAGNAELLSRVHALSESHGGQLLRNFQGFPVPPGLFVESEFARAPHKADLVHQEGPAAAHAQYLRLTNSHRTAFDSIWPPYGSAMRPVTYVSQTDRYFSCKELPVLARRFCSQLFGTWFSPKACCAK
jgi:hypothetical protein